MNLATEEIDPHQFRLIRDYIEKRILSVDDSKATRKFIKRAVDVLGFEFFEAGDRREALAIWQHSARSMRTVLLPGVMNRTEWLKDKTLKNRVKKWIRLELKDIRISAPATGDRAQVGFLLSYSSSNYSDKNRLILVLKKEADAWKILERKAAKVLNEAAKGVTEISSSIQGVSLAVMPPRMSRFLVPAAESVRPDRLRPAMPKDPE